MRVTIMFSYFLSDFYPFRDKGFTSGLNGQYNRMTNERLLKTFVLHNNYGKKHCGKRRKCQLPAFSAFSTIFSKGIFLRACKNRH